MVCSKSGLQGGSERRTGRGNTFSSKIAAAQDGLSTSCKKRILQNAAEIFRRQRTKEIPAVGSKGMPPGKATLAFQEAVSLRVHYFQEFFLHPLSRGLCFGHCVPTFACTMQISWQTSPLPQLVLLAVPNPSPSPCCPHASVEQSWKCNQLRLSSRGAGSCGVGGGCVNDQISQPFQSWVGEGTLLNACRPAAAQSPHLSDVSWAGFLAFYFLPFLKGRD